MEKPPKVGTIWNAKNRWDEFDYTHISLANTTYVSMTLVNSLPGTGGTSGFLSWLFKKNVIILAPFHTVSIIKRQGMDLGKRKRFPNRLTII